MSKSEAYNMDCMDAMAQQRLFEQPEVVTEQASLIYE